MTKLQKLLFAMLIMAAIAILCVRPSQALIQSQRDQIFVNIEVDVTPSPIAYVPRTIARDESIEHLPIEARFGMHARGSADGVDATSTDIQTLVAQTSSQSALKVQATVTPNPNATLLISNPTGVFVIGTAGTTVTKSCIYTVTVDTTKTSWTLKQGLSANLSGDFPGKDLANNSYLQTGTPKPTSSPFIVYPTAWTILTTGGLMKTYCVDLSVTIPSTVAGGRYFTNAVYTLYF